MNTITDITQRFPTIPLKETGKVRLMNRLDTKYVVPVPVLAELLADAVPYYMIQLNMAGERQASYRTLYFDTPDCSMFHQHVLRRLVRDKVRIREYADSGEFFLEVKHKDNHGKTRKQRVEVNARFDDTRDIQWNQMLLDVRHDHHDRALYVPHAETITPHLMNEFQRITLVAKNMSERITIDSGLRFNNLRTGQRAALTEVAIIEVKRDGLLHSPFHDILLRHSIHNMGFSKYCIGSALTNNTLRTNNLKEKLLTISKMQHSAIPS